MAEVKVFHFEFADTLTANKFVEKVNRDVHIYFTSPFAYQLNSGKKVNVQSQGNPLNNAALRYYLKELADSLGGIEND